MGCGASAAAQPTAEESSVRAAPTSAGTGVAPVIKPPATHASPTSPSSPSRKSAVLKVRLDDVIPDDLSAFAGAIEAGHGADTTERFMRQSTGRISQIRSSSARPRSAVRGDSRMSRKELKSLEEVDEECRGRSLVQPSLRASAASGSMQIARDPSGCYADPNGSARSP